MSNQLKMLTFKLHPSSRFCYVGCIRCTFVWDYSLDLESMVQFFTRSSFTLVIMVGSTQMDRSPTLVMHWTLQSKTLTRKVLGFKVFACCNSGCHSGVWTPSSISKGYVSYFFELSLINLTKVKKNENMHPRSTTIPVRSAVSSSQLYLILKFLSLMLVYVSNNPLK